MRGTDCITGKPIEGVERLRQSVLNILTTPIGSRVMRRDYGSRIFDLIDLPMNHAFVPAVTNAVAEALDRWEPLFRFKSLSVRSGGKGKPIIFVTGDYVVSNEELTVEIPL